jgi:hypothetical protein
MMLWESALGFHNGIRGSGKSASRREKRHLLKVASQSSCAGHWPPNEVKGSGCLHRSIFGLPGRLLAFLRAAHWRLLAPGTLCLWLAGPTFSGRLITGAIHIAINMPFVTH